MGKSASLADKIFYSRIKVRGGAAVPCTAQYIVNPVIWTVSFFIKGHGGADKNTVFICSNPVEHRGDIPVIPYVICTSSIDGDCTPCSQPTVPVRAVLYGYIHNFYICILWYEGSNYRRQFKSL